MADSSFEAPALGDSSFASSPPLASQGGYGWSFTPGLGVDSGLYNPPANTYATAGANGTPTGADGAQVGYIVNTGIIVQTLAGPDGMIGSADDPVFEPNTIYTLSAAVGRRLPGNQYGSTDFAGYSIELVAGPAFGGGTVGQLADAGAAIVPGVFVDRTLVVDTSLLPPSLSALYGQPLNVRMRGALTTGVTDFDNVRLDATHVPEPALMLLAVGAACLIPRLRRSNPTASSR